MDFLGPGPGRDDASGFGSGKADRRPYRDGFRYGPPPEAKAAEPADGTWYRGPRIVPERQASEAAGHDGSGRAGRGGAGGSGGTGGSGRGRTEGAGHGEPAGHGGHVDMLGAASPGWSAGDMLESRPERPPAESGLQRVVRQARRRWRAAATTGPWRRRAVAATAAVAAAGAVVALRAGAPAVPIEQAQAAAGSTSGPVIIYGRARMQPPPFDRLPGRTPIPMPSPIGRPAEAVRGTLPATGPGPAEEAARDAARLVLGRYCRYPRAYQVTLTARQGWREVTATVDRRAWAGERRLTTLRLRWTGAVYAWQGRPAELARCS